MRKRSNALIRAPMKEREGREKKRKEKKKAKGKRKMKKWESFLNPEIFGEKKITNNL
jgi:hypothetical protein